MPFMTINRKSPVPIYTQIADQIRSMIAGGDLGPGDPLPSIRLTASQLDIAVNTVARAYRDLEALGIVESNGRKGSFISRDYDPDCSRNPFAAPVMQCLSEGMKNKEIRDLFLAAMDAADKEENHE